MTLRLDTGKTTLDLGTTPEGEVSANGVRVTERGGWLVVRTLASALARGAPATVAVQVQLSHDAQGRAHLAASAVRADGMHYPRVDAVHAPWATFWVASLAAAVWSEIERRVHVAHRPTVSIRAVRPSTLPPAAPEAVARPAPVAAARPVSTPSPPRAVSPAAGTPIVSASSPSDRPRRREA